MKKIIFLTVAIFIMSFSIVINMFSAAVTAAAEVKDKINVVTTLTDYAYFAREIGREKVEVVNICQGDENAHFVRPKPSFVKLCQRADLFIGTGLDLELWVPGLLEKSANKNIQSGQIGYVAAADGIKMLEIPEVLSRSEGGLHVYGNPHITVGPLNAFQIADNILIGLRKVSPENTAYFEKNHADLKDRLVKALYGEQLPALVGAEELVEMTRNNTLIKFLNDNKLKGEPLISKLGGWLKKAMPLRGTKIINYHRSWIYFNFVFGIEAASEIEPKPGIPPTPKHILEVIDIIKKENIKIIFSENFYDIKKVMHIAEKTGAKPVIIANYVDGESGVDTYFKLIDSWLDKMLAALSK